MPKLTYATAVMLGHPSEPETFEFTQTSRDDGRVRRRIKSYVIFDDRWPTWRINAVRLLARCLAALQQKGEAG